MGNLGGGLRQIDWSTQRLEKFEKNFYVEDRRVSSRSEREVEEFRRAKEMRVSFFPSRAPALKFTNYV
jgi:ATP-dependent RNA helicase DDX5/DBP2